MVWILVLFLKNNLKPISIDTKRQISPQIINEAEAEIFSAKKPIIKEPKGIIPLKAVV